MRATCTVAILAQGTTHGPMRSRRPFCGCCSIPCQWQIAVSAACFLKHARALSMLMLGLPAPQTCSNNGVCAKKPATKFPQTGLLQNRTSKPLLAYSAGAPGQKTSVTTAFGPARKQKASQTETTSEHWAEARLKIARMTLTIKRDGNWSSFQLANSALPLSVTSSAIAPSARMHNRGPQKGQQSKGWWHKGLV